MKKISKKKLWIIIACSVAALLIAAAAVTAVILFNNGEAKETDAQIENAKIYWNIDRQIYFGQGENNTSSRTIDKTDGYYHILFSTEGRPTERKAKSLSLVNKIDDNDAMGLVIDEDTREITDIIPLEEISGGYLCKRFYVKEVKDTEIIANSSWGFQGEDLTIKIKTTTPLYDVSTQAMYDAGMPVKLNTLEEKDQITVIKNKDDSIYGIFITKRSAKMPVYWNIERKYDAKHTETTRQPDADGIYRIPMAMGGQQYTIMSKDRNVVSVIDSRGNRSCGLVFDDEGYVIDSISAVKCTGGKSVASWYDVFALEGLNFSAQKTIESSDKGKIVNLSMAPDCEVYNVSDNTVSFIGEETELTISDRVQGFTDPTGKVVLLFIVKRWNHADMYWNVYRMYDATAKKTTRTRQADGYYHFKMCVNGQVTDVKVQSDEIANKIDSAANHCVGLRIENGVAVEFMSSATMYTSKGSWYDVEKFVSDKTIHVKKNQKTASDYGNEYDIDIADDCKIYNVTEYYNNHIGEETTLQVGDRIQAWTDYRGKAAIIYVVGRSVTNNVTAHNSSHACEECGKSVEWKPWTSASSLPTESGHYYLCGNVVTAQASVTENQNVVLCLNGYSVRGSGKRVYAAFGKGATLSIHDCAGTGRIYSNYEGDMGTTQGAIIWARYGTVNIYGGTYEAPAVSVPGHGAVICANGSTTVNIKNATVKGGITEKNGGAIYVAGSAKLYLNNATVIPGTAKSGQGDGIYMDKNSRLNVEGKVSVTGAASNVYFAAGAYMTFTGDLAGGSSIGVATAQTNGKISTNYKSGAEQYITSDNKAYSVTVIGNAVYVSRQYSVVPHKTAHVCEHCGQNVSWTPWTNASALPITSGHYYLCGDVTADQNSVTANQDVVLCLNGYTVKGTGNRIYATFEQGAKLSLADCTGTGRMYNAKTGNFGTTQGAVLWARYGEINVYGGTYEAPSVQLPGNGAVICANGGTSISVKNAAIKGGKTAKSGGAIFMDAGTSLTLENVNITAGEAASGHGDAIYAGKKSSVTLSGNIDITGGKSKLYLADEAYITLAGALADNCRIGVNSGSESGKISTNYISGAENNFVSEKAGYTVKNRNGMLYLDDGSAVPEHANNHACEDCGKNVEWIPWTDKTSLPVTSGHYYLCYDVNANQNSVTANQDVVLCLNGHTVKGTGNRVYATFEQGARLSITDCAGTGKIYNAKTGNFGTTQGAVLWARYGEINVYAGTYEAPTVQVPGNGAVICANNGSSVNIKNATIKGGKTAKNGGAIYAEPNAKLSLENVSITAGEAATEKGDAVFMDKNSALTIAGKIVISGGSSNLYLAEGAYVTLADALSEGSQIGVSTEDAEGRITANYKSGAEKYFISEKEGCTVKIKEDAVYLEAGTQVPAHASAHICEHCGQSVEWTAWTSTTNLPVTSGHYYLCYDVATEQNSVTANQDVVLCLNGHTVKGTGNRVYATFEQGAQLSVTDCVGTGKIYNAKTGNFGTTQGAVLWARHGTINVYAGTYEAPSVQVPGNGAVICANGGTTVNIKNATIKGGKTAKNGGAIYAAAGVKLSLENVTVISGTAAEKGDAIFMDKKSSLTLSGKIVLSGGTKRLYLADGAYITFADELDEGSRITVNSGDAEGKLSTNTVAGVEKFFTSEKSGYVVKVKDDMLYLEAVSSADGKHVHAVYGDCETARLRGISQTAYEYTPVSTEEELVSAINNAVANTPVYIYLTKDIALTTATTGSNSSNYFINLQNSPSASSGWQSGKNKKINLCLNGHTLSSLDDNGDKAVKLFQLNANGIEFALCDCAAEKGALVCTRDNINVGNSGGFFYVAYSSKLYLYGVRLVGGAAKTGGMICVATGTVNAYGCSFENGASTTGMLHLTSANSVANIYDCSFTGATAGYGIYLAEDARTPVLGGSTVVKDNAAGNVYISSGRTLKFISLSEEAKIGVTPEDTTAIFAESDKDYSEICEIFSDIKGKTAVYSDGGYTLKNTAFTTLSVLSPFYTLLKEAGII